MSHIATVEVHMKDSAILALACQRLELAKPVAVTEKRFFDGTKVTGQSVQLPCWNYPVVIDAAGKAWFDNYGGKWGDESQLNKFRQAYAVEAAKAKARQQGYRVQETTNANGQIRLVCQK